MGRPLKRFKLGHFAFTIFPLAMILLYNNCSHMGGLYAGPDGPHAQSKIGINTVGGWSDSPFISRDGQRLYFMYSRYDFAPWMQSGGSVMPVATGPSRLGLHESAVNPWDESDIYMATKNLDGSWSEPVPMGFNGAYGDSSGMELNNGNTFIWLRGNGTTNDIVMSEKVSGSWSAPIVLGGGINDHTGGAHSDNPHISPDGKGLWFVSNRAGGAGGNDIWFSMNSSGTLSGAWSAPVNAGTPYNSSGDEDQPWISPATMEAYWNGPGGLMHCTTNVSGCATVPVAVTIPGCSYPAEVSLPDDGQTMYFACGDTTTFKIKIMYSVKQANGSWGPATPVD